MNWSTNSNEPNSPEVSFESTASLEHTMLSDFWIVIYRMFERQEEDRAKNPHGIALFSNASNGYVRLNWVDKDLNSVGDWNYTIWLREFFKLCQDHPNESNHYNETAWTLAAMLAEDLYNDVLGGAGLPPIDENGKPDPSGTVILRPKTPIQFYFLSELKSEPKAIVI